MGLEIKLLQKEDVSDYIRLQQQAYPTFYQGTDDEIKRIQPILEERLNAEDLEFYGAYEDGSLVACLLYLKFQMNFHGHMIPVHGIGSVAVSLLHKKKGLAKNLILYTLDHARKMKVPMFSLYPFRPDFYERFGFGFGTKLYEYHIKPEHFINHGHLNHLSGHVSPEEINDFYEKSVPKVHGRKLKSTLDKKSLKGSKIIAYKENNEIKGYFTYRQQKIEGQTFMSQKMVVEEMVYDHPRVLGAFSSFFHVQKDQVNFIELYTFEDNFYQFLNNYDYGLQPKIMPYVSHKGAEVGVGLMWQALDIPFLLELIANRCHHKINFLIQSPKGEISNYTLNKNNHTQVNLEMNLASFSSWLMGCVSLYDLYSYQKLKTDREDLLDQLDHDFDFKKPMCLAKF